MLYLIKKKYFLSIFSDSYSITILCLLTHILSHLSDEAQRVFEKANYPPEMIPFLLSDIEEMVKIDQESSDWKTVLCCPTELIKTTMIIGYFIHENHII